VPPSSSSSSTSSSSGIGSTPNTRDIPSFWHSPATGTDLDDDA
jgi:hypothetical protein